VNLASINGYKFFTLDNYMKIIKPLIALAVLTFSGYAHSAILFDNFDNLDPKPTIDPTNMLWNDTFRFGWTIYDDFQLSAESTITGINYSIFTQDSAHYIQTYVSIRKDDSEGSIIVDLFPWVGTLTSNGYDIENTDLVTYGFDVALSGLDIFLAAGTYALGLSTEMSDVEGSLLAQAGIGSGDRGFGDPLSQALGGNDPTAKPGNHMAFSLIGSSASVPEPSVIALFGLGLLGLGFARRRIQT
jgi:hypothetical protein